MPGPTFLPVPASHWQADPATMNDITDATESAEQFALAAGKKEWFKRIDYGETLGKIIFKYVGAMADELHIQKMFTELSNWIDN